MSYSSAIYMDLSTHALVNADYTPFKPAQPSRSNDPYAYQTHRNMVDNRQVRYPKKIYPKDQRW